MLQSSSVFIKHVPVLMDYFLNRVDAEAVPKRILDLMNVEGLTRENVASHLQALISRCSL